MISSITALADRNFIVGILLPVVLAALALLFALQDVTWVRWLWTAVSDADSLAKLTLPLLAVWSLAVLFSVFNIAFFHLLEGESGPLATKARRRRAQDARETRRLALNPLYAAAGRDGPESQAWWDYYAAARRFKNDFPPAHLVQPTAFGNVVRAAETYSLQVYGIDAAQAWLRLMAVVPSDHQATVNAARAEVDFFVNSCVLSILTAALTLAYAIGDGAGVAEGALEWDATIIRCLVVCAASIATVYLSYRLAIDRARVWGDLVRSTFDLYLPDLAKQLGYPLPRAKDERLQFWTAVNAMLLDLKPMDSGRWLPAEAPPDGDASDSAAEQRSLVKSLLRVLRGR